MDQLANSAAPIRFVDEDTIRPLLRLKDLIPAMERALADFSAGRVVAAGSQHFTDSAAPRVYGRHAGGLRRRDGREAGHSLSRKRIARDSHASGRDRALQRRDWRAAGNDGWPSHHRAANRSCFGGCDEAVVGCRRCESLAILGSGVQARSHFRALSLVRKFDDVRVWSRNPQHAQALAE